MFRRVLGDIIFFVVNFQTILHFHYMLHWDCNRERQARKEIWSSVKKKCRFSNQRLGLDLAILLGLWNESGALMRMTLGICQYLSDICLHKFVYALNETCTSNCFQFCDVSRLFFSLSSLPEEDVSGVSRKQT